MTKKSKEIQGNLIKYWHIDDKCICIEGQRNLFYDNIIHSDINAVLRAFEKLVNKDFEEYLKVFRSNLEMWRVSKTFIQSNSSKNSKSFRMFSIFTIARIKANDSKTNEHDRWSKVLQSYQHGCERFVITIWLLYSYNTNFVPNIILNVEIQW